MAGPKTIPTDVAVSDHLVAIEDDVRRGDVDGGVLEALAAHSVAVIRRRYPATSA